MFATENRDLRQAFVALRSIGKLIQGRLISLALLLLRFLDHKKHVLGDAD